MHSEINERNKALKVKHKGFQPLPHLSLSATWYTNMNFKITQDKAEEASQVVSNKTTPQCYMWLYILTSKEHDDENQSQDKDFYEKVALFTATFSS